MTIWFATGNSHKRAELAALFPGHTVKIPADENRSFEPDETGATFAENALIKARELYRLVSAPVIADDSGLCVDALDGRPGVYSARYGGAGFGGGKKLSPPERNALLLQELGDNPCRQARFVCAMVLLFSEDRFYLVQETLEGELTREARGRGGFGYDPILYLPQAGCTVAELPAEEKNRISHRGKAGRAVAKLLTEQ
ncbi:MAG: RdgB/HAM1 family non-canonical purine NTP pyrophosphatase [Treponema sp.]|jgi:XTP/dITP diphosphohydrolase|nr:RdgB/HAM1 family non-canonical purine NTP pyrophosphatase [Treponema sp.]